MDFKVGKWKLSLGTPTIGEPKAGEKTVKMYWVFNHGKRATTYPISEETKNELVKKRLGAGISFMPIKVPESQYKKICEGRYK
ncbi:MAG: hypothetical protein M1448_00380 [Candidatus Marsarchaeota archaeon]|nr:hypothetical protein [Candidatus Marsarchaeota archaeon]